MSENFRLDRKIGFQNTFYTKCINVIIDSIGPSINLRSIVYQSLQSPSVRHHFQTSPLKPLGQLNLNFYGYF